MELENDSGCISSSSIEESEEDEDDGVQKPPSSVISFQHCIKGRRFFCSVLPSTCPSCKKPLLTDSFIVAPFCIFAPWTSSLNAPCSLVLKISVGSFLYNYNGFEDLHVGISDSNGSVTHYDEGGLLTDPWWEECLSVVIDPTLRFTGTANVWTGKEFSREAQCRWDNMISMYKISWRKSILHKRYCAVSNNCFDFVWEFTKSYISLSDPSSISANLCHIKEAFTEHFLLPVVEKALKFNRLQLNVAQKSIFIIDGK